MRTSWKGSPTRRAAGVLVCALLALPALGQEVRLRAMGALYMDAQGAGMSSPEGVASDGGSLVIVADTGNRRLLRYDRVDDQLRPSGEIRLGQLPYPTQVRIDSGGEILALDGRSHRIVRVDPDGEFKGIVELTSGDDSRGVLTKSFELDDEDNLYVLDVAGARVLVFDRQGAPLRRIEFPPDVGFVSDLAVDGSGVVFAVDSVRKRVLSARPADEALVPLAADLADDSAFPTVIVADRLGRLFLADQGDGGIVILARDGSLLARQSAMGWREGFLRYPSGLSAAGDTLFVADRGNNRVQIFSVMD